jgi:ATP-dependent DNA helicase RecQ
MTALKSKKTERAAPLDGRLLGTLRERFRLDSFRPGQREIIKAILDGRDTLAIMPTGSGKSLVYQLPSLLLDGLTVVVSPLIALMKDQTDKLAELGVEAATINSSLTTRQQNAALRARSRGPSAHPLRHAREVSRPRLLRDAAATPRRAASSSTRRTASATGGTTSGRTT